MTQLADGLQTREPFDRAAETEPHTYRAQTGSDFRVEHPEGTVALRLASVSNEQVAGGYLQFSLYFHGPAARILPQGIYLFRHDTLGALALFIVPVLGSNHERIVYEACFNRRATGHPASDSLEGGA